MTDFPSQLLAELGRATLPPEVAEDQQRRRAGIVQRLEALDASVTAKAPQLRHYWLRGVAAVALAAGVALAVGLRSGAIDGSSSPKDTVHVSVVDGKVRLGEPGQPEAPNGELDLTDDEHVVTPGGSQATLKLASGALIDLSATTEVRFGGDAGREAIELYKGSVALRVPKLSPGRKIEVNTFDTKVTVHGTRFSVTVKGEPERQRWTEVDLTKGVIAIDSGAQHLLLKAPSRWSSRLLSTPAGRMGVRSVSRTEANGPGSGGAKSSTKLKQPASRSTGLETDSPSLARGEGPSATNPPRLPLPEAADEKPRPVRSTLAEQNELFSRAKREAHSGQLAAAAQTLGAFLDRYPASPLRQNAEVERFRVLSNLGRAAEAARVARRYLATYPRGFARDEAREIAIGKP